MSHPSDGSSYTAPDDDLKDMQAHVSDCADTTASDGADRDVPRTAEEVTKGVRAPVGVHGVVLDADHPDAATIWDASKRAPKVKPETAAGLILEHYPAAKMLDGRIAFYDGGVYKVDPGGDKRLTNATIGRVLGDKYSTGRRADIAGRLEGMVQDTCPDMPNTPGAPIVNFRNGLYNLATKEFSAHTPDHLSVLQLEVDYDPDATCPRYDEWILDRVGEEQALMLDAMGAAIVDPSVTSQKALMLMGPGGSGKSTMLRLFSAVFPDTAVSAVTMHQLADNKYAAAELYGAAINVAADLSSEHITDVSLFKQVTGEDKITADRKYGNMFSFTNTSTFAFSANNPPTISEGDAFERRMVPAAFPKSFKGAEDETIEQGLLEELPGIVNRWLAAYGQVPKAHPAVKSMFHAASNIYKRFLDDCCVVTEHDLMMGDPTWSAYWSGPPRSNEVHTGGMRATNEQLYAAISEFLGEPLKFKRTWIKNLRELLPDDFPEEGRWRTGSGRGLRVAIKPEESWEPMSYKGLIPQLWPDDPAVVAATAKAAAPVLPAAPVQPRLSDADRAAIVAKAIAESEPGDFAELQSRIPDRKDTSGLRELAQETAVRVYSWDPTGQPWYGIVSPEGAGPIPGLETATEVLQPSAAGHRAQFEQWVPNDPPVTSAPPSIIDACQNPLAYEG